jgi:hypothetical protein
MCFGLNQSLPSIFSDFPGKTLRLLYRASRDGFPGAFHRLCDEHTNAIVVAVMDGFLFGGYTSLPWSGRRIAIRAERKIE